MPRLTLRAGRSINRKRGSSGFMLLDAILALSIALLLAIVIWPLVGARTAGAQIAAAALDITTLLRRDRTAASLQGRPSGTRFDLSRRLVTDATGRSVEIPRDASLEVMTAPQCADGQQRFLITFAPDGSSCGGVLTLREGSLAFRIRVNWLSGMIDVARL
jgi:general secretion pathway protein H